MARDISDEEKERINKGIDPEAARKRLADKGTESGGSLAGPLEMLERKLDNGNYDQELAMKRGGSYNNAATYNDKDGLSKVSPKYNSAATYNAKDGFPIAQARLKPTPMDTDEFGPSNTAMNAGEFAGPLASSRAQGMQSGVAYPTDRPLPQRPRQEPTRDPNRPQFDSLGDMFSSIFSKK